MSTRPLRILQVYRTFFPDTQGGAEETIRQIAAGLNKLGMQSRVFVPSPNPEPKIVDVSGIEVVRSKMHFEVASCGFALTSFSEFRRQVAWSDIVHYHFPWPFADLLDLVSGVDKPKIVTYHSDIVRQKGLLALYRPLMNRFLRGADRVVATSPQYAATSDTLSTLETIDVVPIGIEESSYPEPSSGTVTDVSERFGSGYFFFIGMLRYYKGLHILLEACRGQNFKVVIAGSGPEEGALRKMVRDYQLSNVIFAGRVSDEEKIALIDNALAMVFPSHLRSEAFGVTLLEGLMRGKPLITAEVGTGTSFVNEKDKTGFIVPPNDPAALQQAMLAMQQSNLANKMGNAGRARFEHLFTADQMVRGYMQVYEKALGQVS